MLTIQHVLFRRPSDDRQFIEDIDPGAAALELQMLARSTEAHVICTAQPLSEELAALLADGVEHGAEVPILSEVPLGEPDLLARAEYLWELL